MKATRGKRQTARARAGAEAHELVFRRRGREEVVLRGCSLQINVGERVLEGASGGGKSTLASLLTGMRRPPRAEDIAEARAVCRGLGLG